MIILGVLVSHTTLRAIRDENLILDIAATYDSSGAVNFLDAFNTSIGHFTALTVAAGLS